MTFVSLCPAQEYIQFFLTVLGISSPYISAELKESLITQIVKGQLTQLISLGLCALSLQGGGQDQHNIP